MIQDFIFIKKNGRFEKVSFSELIYIKGMRGYLEVVTFTQIYFVLNTMEEILKHLPRHLFCRIHRSYIVCISKISAFDNTKLTLNNPSNGSKIPGLTSKNELPVSRAFRKKLRESVCIVPNRMNKYSKKILANAEFLQEVELEED